jgi:outer membrane lipoprotein-sorting protein
MRHFLIPVLLAAAPAAAQAPSLANVQAALAATRSMTAEFVQTAPNGGVARGTLSLQRPGRIRFDYGPGAKTLVVADGRQLSFVDYEVAQVSQWPVKSTPLGVLLQPDADLSRVAKIVPSPMPGRIAVDAQDPKRPDLGRIQFYLRPDAAAPGRLALEGWRSVDAQGGTTQVQLANARYNIDLPSNRFTFRDPRTRTRPGGRAG